MPVWFKPKRYGYGATPVTWQGWALVIGFVAVVLALAWGLIGFDGSVTPDSGSLVIFLICVAVLIAAMWVVTKRTTDGAWRWRWGDR